MNKVLFAVKVLELHCNYAYTFRQQNETIHEENLQKIRKEKSRLKSG